MNLVSAMTNESRRATGKAMLTRSMAVAILQANDVLPQPGLCPANQRRIKLTAEQRAEIKRMADNLGICLQQAYVRLRAGSISLSSI